MDERDEIAIKQFICGLGNNYYDLTESEQIIVKKMATIQQYLFNKYYIDTHFKDPCNYSLDYFNIFLALENEKISEAKAMINKLYDKISKKVGGLNE